MGDSSSVAQRGLAPAFASHRSRARAATHVQAHMPPLLRLLRLGSLLGAAAAKAEDELQSRLQTAPFYTALPPDDVISTETVAVDRFQHVLARPALHGLYEDMQV
eukprot:6210870-Pleurochrysis_carterae.AAC.2